MTTSELQDSVRGYVDDYDCLISGVEFYLNLQQQVVKDGNIDVIRRHHDAYPEDKLCHIYRPGDRGMVLCRRSGIDAIRRTTLRLTTEAPNGYDLSSKRIAEIISERVLQVAIDGITSDEELVRTLKSYVALSELEHIEATHYFPCILLHVSPTHADIGPPPPEEMVLGPVKFQRFAAFLKEFREAVERGEKRPEEKSIDMFSEVAGKDGWVASVRVPRCAPDVSLKRAEQIVEAAINLVKVFIGLDYARSMRLPHTAASRNSKTCVLTDVGGDVAWRWQGQSLEGALVVGDPITSMPQDLREFAALLLTRGLIGHRSDFTNKLLDALKWFGDASFEESNGVRIVKWIAALERLTTTERLVVGVTHSFCMRVALLAAGLGAGDVEKAYRDARIAYELRSDIMHGSRSQDDAHLMVHVRLVHDLTREAMLGSIAAHHLLDWRIGDASVAGLSKLYERAAVRSGPLFDGLQKEFRRKNRSVQRPIGV